MMRYACSQQPRPDCGSISSKYQQVADSVLEKEYVQLIEGFTTYLINVRKSKPAGQLLGSGFSWPQAGDAMADIYCGVS